MRHALDPIRFFQCAALAVALLLSPQMQRAEAMQRGVSHAITTGAYPLDERAPPVVDCDTLAKSGSYGAEMLRKCNVRKRGGAVYAFPKIEWQELVADDIADDLKKWAKTRGQQGVLKELKDMMDEQGLQDNYAILSSGNAAAARKFIEVQNMPDGTVIGGITLNADTRKNVHVHAPKVRRTGKAPVILMLYDQYEGRLYMHAFKIRRVGNKTATLHARISPLHLDFLQGNREYLPSDAPSDALATQAFRKFYSPLDANPADPGDIDTRRYLFDGIDLAGAYTAAGRMARYIKADTVMAYIPSVDIWQSKTRSGGLISRKVHVHTFASIKPQWFFAFPQITVDPDMAAKFDANVGIQTAICAGKLTVSNHCDAVHNVIPSQLTIMEADPELSPSINVEEQNFFYDKQSYSSLTFFARILIVAVAVAVASFAIVQISAAVGGGSSVIATGLKSLAYAIEGYGGAATIGAGAGALYTGASLINGARGMRDMQQGFFEETMSTGGADESLSIAANGGVTKSVAARFDKLLSQHDIDKTSMKSLRQAYNGFCSSDEVRVDECRKEHLVGLGYCTAGQSPDECRDSLGDSGLFSAHTGLVPRPGTLIPAAGAERVAAMFLEDDGVKALKKSAQSGGLKSHAPQSNVVHCTWQQGGLSAPCVIQGTVNPNGFWIIRKDKKWKRYYEIGAIQSLVSGGDLAIAGGVNALANL